MNSGCMISTVPEIGTFAASSWLDKDLDEAVEPLVEDVRTSRKSRMKDAAAKGAAD